MKLGASYVEIRAKHDKMKRDLSDAKGNFGKSMDDMESRARMWSSRLVAIGATAIAGIGVASLTKDIFASGRAFAALEKSFNQITGSAAATNKEFGFLRDLANRTGQNFYHLTDSYKGFMAASKGTNLEGQKTREVFESVVKAGASLGLTSDQVSGSLYAVQQMMSKGNVSAEELRQQLGERLPGAFNLMAEAMGVSTGELNKMLERGEVLAEDALPKLARVLRERYSGEVDEATRATNKFDEAMEDLRVNAARSGFLESASTAINSLADVLKDEEVKEGVAALASGLGKMAVALASIAQYADLRSIHTTMQEAAELSRQGRLDIVEFSRSGFVDRQRMVDEARGQNAVGEPLVKSFSITDPMAEVNRLLNQSFDFSDVPAPATGKPAGATKKTANDKKKAIEDFSKAYRKITLDDYDYAVSVLEDEVASYKAAGADKTQLAEYYTRKLGDLQNEHLAAVEGSNNEQYESELTKWKRIDRASMAGVDAAIERHEQLTDEAESSAAEQADAYRKLYDDLGQVSRESYLFKVGLLDQEYNQLKKILGDSALLQAAYARRKKELDWEMRLSTDDFLDGMLVAWEKHEDEKLTLAEHGAQLWKGIQESMASGFHDLFYDALTGDLDSLSDYADAVWRGIANSFATMAADMVAEYAMSGLKDLLTGEGGDSLIGGIIGAASGIWDAVDWLGSDMLSLWHTGAYMISEDQIAKLKAGEMVIPAEQAAELRALIEGSGGGIPWGDAPWMAGGEGGIGGIGGGTAGGAAGISAGNAIGMAAAQGAALGVAATMGLGVSQGIGIGSTLGEAAQSGVMGGLVGAIGGVPGALGAESAAADIGTALGTAIGSALGVPGLGAAALGALGAIGLDAVADALGLAIGTPGTSVMGMIGSALGIGDQGMTGYGGFGGLGIGNPGSYGGDNGGGIGGGLGSGEGMGGLGSGEGMGGGTGIGGVSGDPAGDSADNGGGWARGGWAVGPTSGYAATLHGTEYVLNQDQVKAVRDLVGGGRGAVVQIYFDSPELERFVKVKSQDAQIKRERRAQRGRRDTTGSTPARVY